MEASNNSYLEQGMQDTNSVIAISQDDLNSFSSYINKKIADFLNLPDGQTLENVDWSSFSSIISLISGMLITVSLTVFFLWLIRAIALYTMAKKNKDDLAFLSFIPYSCLYTMGKLVGKTKLFWIDISKPELVLPILVFSMYLPFAAPISLFLFVLIYNSFLYRIYQNQCKNFAALFTFIGFLLPFLQPFILFFIRNSKKEKSISR